MSTIVPVNQTKIIQGDSINNHQRGAASSEHFWLQTGEINRRGEVQQSVRGSVQGKLSRHRRSGVLLAIKIIKKETIKKENFQEQLIRELKIQSFLSHVNLVKLYAFFHDRLNIYLLLEFCAGGQLYDLFRVKSKLKEEEWQPLMKGVCEGLY